MANQADGGIQRREVSWNRQHAAALERARALLALKYRYGDWYSITYSDDLYQAVRTGTDRRLAIGTSAALGEMIMTDLLDYPVHHSS